ncbi:MAG TPA: ATP-binding protein, partial [Longimicrobiales bacterium]|nr:ATP-binding protein [Longimicrobiales bacterium]
EGGLLTIGVREDDAASPRYPERSQRCAVLDVADCGIGIAPEDLDRIFEPFRQLQSATTRTQGGTGLGLAVTRRFVDLLGGTISIDSEVGKGTRFTIRVPLSPPA